MWIWYVDRTEGGDPAKIAARAKRYGIGTLYIKSSDGGSYWGQFNTTLVERLHEAGLSVCAWAFVYGDTPVAEAKVAATAVKRGADCFVIDAEGEYEGKYAAADRYMRSLRARIGENSRSRWRPSPTSTTTRRSPTRSSSPPAAPSSTSRRCTGRRSGPRSAASSSTPTSSTASGTGPSTRSARPTWRPRARKSSSSAASPRTTAARR